MHNTNTIPLRVRFKMGSDIFPEINSFKYKIKKIVLTTVKNEIIFEIK